MSLERKGKGELRLAMQIAVPTKMQLGKNQQLEHLFLKFNGHPKGKWIMSLDNIVQLVRIIKESNPTQILELGTGIGASTACMASVLDNAHITTIEQNDKVMELAKELIPFELKKKITFVNSPATVIKPIPIISPFQFWSCYMEIPWAKWDLVVIDGPGPFLLKDHLASLPNGDIIWLLPKILPNTKIFLQGRQEARKLYKRSLGWYLEVIEETNDYCLFKRTNQPLKEDLSDFLNSDTVRGKLLDNGYWE